jgi:carboxypeptidase PM20D1
MRKLFLVLILFIILFLGIITLYNTFSAFSKQLNIKAEPRLALNDSLALIRLSAALRIPLVNNPIDSIFIKAEKQFPEFLAEAFPAFHNDPSVNSIKVAANSRLYRWTGRNNRLKPILLIAEIDVKDPELSKIPQWTYNPFMGKIADSFIWGAGVMESKSAAIAILEALEAAISLEKLPQRTLYLALVNSGQNNKSNSHDILSKLLYEDGLEFEFILNTGSFISEGSCRGLDKGIAALACSERSQLDMSLKNIQSESIKEDLGKIALTKNSLPTDGAAADQLLETLIPELTFLDKWLLSNRFLFGFLSDSRLKKEPFMSEMFDITMEITKMEAGEIKISWFLPPDSDLEKFKHFIAKNLGRTDIEWSSIGPKRGLSPNQGYAFEVMQTSIRQGIGPLIVLPTINSKPGSSAYYSALSPSVFDFRPWSFDAAETERLRSGIDQRLAVEQYLQGVNFYRVLFRNTLF